MIEFFCPSCGRAMSAHDSAVGVVGHCPICRAAVTVPVPVWTPKPAPIITARRAVPNKPLEQLPLLEAADEPFAFGNDSDSNAIPATHRTKSVKSNFAWFAMALLAIVLSAFFAANMFPWTMLLTSVFLAGIGLAFLVVPAARIKMQERIPILGTHPKSKFVASRIIAYCVLLFCFSVWTIREDWQAQAHEEQLATLIHDAERSVKVGQLDEASDITRRLETDRGIRDPAPVKELRSKVDAALKARDVSRANDRVTRKVNAASEKFLAREYGEVERHLSEAFSERLATELRQAHKLADELVSARVTLARDLIVKSRLVEAKQVGIEAINVPGATKLKEAHAVLAQVSNIQVAAMVENARELLKARLFGEAEKQIQVALSEKFATELADARGLLETLKDEREQDANAKVRELAVEADRLFKLGKMSDAEKIARGALSTQFATKFDDANTVITQLKRWQDDKREKELAALERRAMATAERKERDAQQRRERAAKSENMVQEPQKSSSDGMVTVSGYFASTSFEDLDRAIGYLNDNDDEALAKLMAMGRVIKLKGGLQVSIIQTKLLSGAVKIRPRGQTIELWTNMEAVKK